ncbi:unnamed protein product [Boreogadus saida]
MMPQLLQNAEHCGIRGLASLQSFTRVPFHALLLTTPLGSIWSSSWRTCGRAACQCQHQVEQVVGLRVCGMGVVAEAIKRLTVGRSFLVEALQ